MNHQVSQRISKRVADYFVVVGADDNLKLAVDNESPIKRSFADQQNVPVSYQADIIDRYPLEDRVDFSLPDGIQLFCFPDGLRICGPHPPTFHSFVHTSEHGSHIMGCCLTIYEPLTAKQKLTVLGYNNPPSPDPKGRSSCDEKFIPLCLCLISHWPFVSSFKSFLCGLYRISVSKSRIPLERIICNFIDEVPAPPAGRVDITYYLGDEDHSQAISFRCPPINQPNVWSSMPLFPLFECLSPDNVLSLFALLLTERQLIFVSSQYSLLTSCAEAMTSLIYPLSWTHAYIPILPKQLLGVLGAPFPYLVGIHSSFLTCADCVLPHEGALIDLDKNIISYGRLGPPPLLPDKRCRKLHQLIISSAPAYGRRGTDWKESRLPLFDSAFTIVTDSAAMECEKSPEGLAGLAGLSRNSRDGEVDEVAVRAGFLNFFVAILKNYRRYIIYGNSIDPDPLVKFRFTEFLAEHPSDWQPFLKELTSTQMFSVFVDERALQFVEGDKMQDVIFFDESIDAKMNRYMFKFRNIDTPFLLDNANLHAKTYVTPTPNTDGLSVDGGVRTYEYQRFPALSCELFSAPRKLPALLDAGRSLAAMYQARLKLISAAVAPVCGPQLTALECIYSCYLVTVSHFVCNSTRVIGTRKATQATTTQQIIEEYTGAAGLFSSTHSVSSRSRSVSTAASEGEGGFARSTSNVLRFDTYKIEHPDLGSDSVLKSNTRHGAVAEEMQVELEVDFMGTPRCKTHIPSTLRTTGSSDMILFDDVFRASDGGGEGKWAGEGEEGRVRVAFGSERVDTNGLNGDVVWGSLLTDSGKSLPTIHNDFTPSPSPSQSVRLSLPDNLSGLSDNEGDIDIDVNEKSLMNRTEGETDIETDMMQNKYDGNSAEEHGPVLTPFPLPLPLFEPVPPLLTTPLDISKVRNGHHAYSQTPSHAHSQTPSHAHHTPSAHHTHSAHVIRRRTGSISAEDEAFNLAAAKLGLKVAFEVLSSLGRLQAVPDDIVYRSLADACGACGCPSEAVALLVHLGDEGMLPDNLMLTAVARAFSGEGNGKNKGKQVQRLSAAEVWTTHDWSKVQRKIGEYPLYLRKRAKGGTISYPSSMPQSVSNHNNSSSSQNLIAVNIEHGTSSLSVTQGAGQGTGQGVGPVGTPPTNRIVKMGSKEGVLGPTNLHPDPHGTAAVTSPSTISPISVSPTRSPNLPAPISLSSALTMGLFPDFLSSSSAPPQFSAQLSRSPARTSDANTQSRGERTHSERNSAGSSSSGSGGARDYWTGRPGDGSVPDLQWRDLSSPHRRPAFAISRLLNRHMLAAEHMLAQAFPGLDIDLCNPMGTCCPSPKCRKADRDTLSIGELYRGFTSPSSAQLQASHGASFPGTGDPNKYTTRCPVCGFQFVPRFTVRCDAKGWIGSTPTEGPGDDEGLGSVLWCELLSPWTLRKEMFNVLFQDGVSSLVAEDFHRSSAQHAVVFWNAIISFRLRGLPYAFLLSNDVICKAFPPRDPPVSVVADMSVTRKVRSDAFD